MFQVLLNGNLSSSFARAHYIYVVLKLHKLMKKYHIWELDSADLNWKLHKQEHFWLFPELHPVKKKAGRVKPH